MPSGLDTLKLYDPIPDSIVSSPNEIFTNCIAMRDNTIKLVANGIQHNIEAEASLEKLIVVNADNLKLKKLYILCDNSISFEKLVTTIGYLKANAINNYKVVRIDTLMYLNEPIAIMPPHLLPQKDYTNDSSYISLSISGKGMELCQAGRMYQASDTTKLDKLLQHLPTPMDNTRVVIKSDENISINHVLSVIRLLKKRGYVLISMSTSPE